MSLKLFVAERNNNRERQRCVMTRIVNGRVLTYVLTTIPNKDDVVKVDVCAEGKFLHVWMRGDAMEVCFQSGAVTRPYVQIMSSKLKERIEVLLTPIFSAYLLLPTLLQNLNEIDSAFCTDPMLCYHFAKPCKLLNIGDACDVTLSYVFNLCQAVINVLDNGESRAISWTAAGAWVPSKPDMVLEASYENTVLQFLPLFEV